MRKIDFSKTLKDLYSATKKIKEVKVESGTFLYVDGKGKPGGKEFTAAIASLYPVVYTGKFALKFGGGPDFAVSKLEVLWDVKAPKRTPLSQWKWRIMIRIPKEFSAAHLKKVIKTVQAKQELAMVVKRTSFKEGRCLQTMHVGPYDEVEGTYRALVARMEELGLTINGKGHEIYMNDPRRVPPERLKTIVRMPVKKGRKH